LPSGAGTLGGPVRSAGAGSVSSSLRRRRRAIAGPSARLDRGSDLLAVAVAVAPALSPGAAHDHHFSALLTSRNLSSRNCRERSTRLPSPANATFTAASLWCLTFAAFIVSWRVRRHVGSRAMTAIVCYASLLRALVSAIFPDGGLSLPCLAIGLIPRGIPASALPARRRARYLSRLARAHSQQSAKLDLGALDSPTRCDRRAYRDGFVEAARRGSSPSSTRGCWSVLRSRRVPETGKIIEIS